MKNILLILVTIIGFIFPQDCEEPQDVWFKIANDVNNGETYGTLIALDMSKGFATTDGIFIYLIVFDKNTRERLVVSFPIGYWMAEKIDKFKKIVPKNEKEEFDLDEYLKRNKGKSRMINANITKVGE